MRTPARGLASVLATLLLVSACAVTGTRRGGSIRFEGAVPLAPPAAQLDVVSLDELRGVVAGFQPTPVVVNLWASWCGPCEAEAPLLRRAAERFGDRVRFVGVDVRDAPRPAAAFLQRHGIGFLNVADPEGAVQTAARSRGLPTTLIVDPNGRVTATITGAITEQQLAAHLEALTSH